MLFKIRNYETRKVTESVRPNMNCPEPPVPWFFSSGALIVMSKFVLLLFLCVLVYEEYLLVGFFPVKYLSINFK